jgi:pyridoxal/pyridoxine/pyridoxamine kinase
VLFCLQFSNHTGYPTIKGHVFDGGHLRELLAGLTSNGLICHTHLLSGEKAWSNIDAIVLTTVRFSEADRRFSECVLITRCRCVSC